MIFLCLFLWKETSFTRRIMVLSRTPKSYDNREMGINYTAGASHYIQGQHYVLGTENEIEKWDKKA